MSTGINKVIVLGNLGRDPEIKQFNNGSAVCNLSIATSETWIDKTTGAKMESTEWHRVVLNNRLAEVAGQYLYKGSKVYVEGKLKTRKWQNQLGQDQYTTEIRASVMQMLDPKSQTSFDDTHKVSSPEHPAIPSKPRATLDSGSSTPTHSLSPNDAWDDEIPF